MDQCQYHLVLTVLLVHGPHLGRSLVPIAQREHGRQSLVQVLLINVSFVLLVWHHRFQARHLVTNASHVELEHGLLTDRSNVICVIVARGHQLLGQALMLFVFRVLRGRGRLLREQQLHQHAFPVMPVPSPMPFKLPLPICAYLVLLVNGHP